MRPVSGDPRFVAIGGWDGSAQASVLWPLKFAPGPGVEQSEVADG
jgi:hypothetical protein